MKTSNSRSNLYARYCVVFYLKLNFKTLWRLYFQGRLICESLFIKHNINEAHASFQLQNQDNSEIHASWKISYPEMNLNFVIINKFDWNTERGSGIFFCSPCVFPFSPWYLKLENIMLLWILFSISMTLLHIYNLNLTRLWRSWLVIFSKKLYS